MSRQEIRLQCKFCGIQHTADFPPEWTDVRKVQSEDIIPEIVLPRPATHLGACPVCIEEGCEKHYFANARLGSPA